MMHAVTDTIPSLATRCHRSQAMQNSQPGPQVSSLRSPAETSDTESGRNQTIVAHQLTDDRRASVDGGLDLLVGDVRTFLTGSSAASPRPVGAMGTPALRALRALRAPPTAPTGPCERPPDHGWPHTLRPGSGGQPARRLQIVAQLRPSWHHMPGPRSTAPRTSSRRPLDRLIMVTFEPPTRSASIARRSPASRALRVAARWPSATLDPGHRRATGPGIGSVALPWPPSFACAP